MKRGALSLAAAVAFVASAFPATFDRSLDVYTVLVDNSQTAKRTLVFVGDGFSFSEQQLFRRKVDEAIQHLKNFDPFSSNFDLFRIVRMNVLSPESGVDHPNEGIRRNSAFNSSYGDANERYISTDDSGELLTLVDFYLPDSFREPPMVIVLVNDAMHGGSAFGRVLYASIRKNFARIVSHELGHAIGRLADEYDCGVCDGSDDNNSNCTVSGAFEHCETYPQECNVTERRAGDPAKWSADAMHGIGLIQGARYYHLGMWRAQKDCHMRTLDSPFCAVCLRALNLRLSEMRAGGLPKATCPPQAAAGPSSPGPQSARERTDR